jgi:ATP-dependent 26S proteasome regulatory subunit
MARIVSGRTSRSHPIVQVMGKNKVLVKVHPEGKYVVDIDKDIDISKMNPGARVALRNDSYTLHLLLPSKIDPLVSLMKVEKVPDSTYDMIGGLDQQIKEIKEVKMCIDVSCSRHTISPLGHVAGYRAAHQTS